MKNILRFHQNLHRWYGANGRRDLPWRNTRDAYAIWVSEVMLQQTQVKTVLERYYFPFLKRFPTVHDLAAAGEAEVLKAWQGMGYYRRARNLHQAAKLWGSVELAELPGVGRNTANAVSCFAHGAAVPVMEANVKRVMARIFAWKAPNEKELWAAAGQLLDTKNAYDYNQAMMDVGAMICTPRAPKCGECPANVICQGQVAPEKYPAKREKKKLPVRQVKIIVRQSAEGKYFAAPRTGNFLSGMYGFEEKASAEGTYLGRVTHAYSHFQLEAEVYVKKTKETGGFTLTQLKKLPHSRTEAKIIHLLSA